MAESGVAAGTELGGYLFAAGYEGGNSLAAMVGHAWDLDDLARGYDDFLQAFSERLHFLQFVQDFKLKILGCVLRYRRYFLHARPIPLPVRHTVVVHSG